MSTGTLIAVLIGMTVVTYGVRVAPLFLAGRVTIPESVLRWMNYVPPAVLATLVLPSLITPDSHTNALELGLNNPLLLAAVPTVLVAWRTKNMYATVGVGVLAVALLRWFAPFG
ncbi:AzlD domain-containing protein [Streptomyces sp. NBC_01304]|uniref:AzlD domain-containing protein n=1 Tax=Streptomyces sp. NBC_01304 TaxID=2903818 RepID=UPI002E14886C|nr:AzlD domain-containing protein [Streptomyces sp. NBC_01304]